MIREIVKSRKPEDILVEILTFLLVVLITTFVIRFTWNNSLVPHINILKPIKTFADALLLSITINIFRTL
jgi:hypothetical protein